MDKILGGLKMSSETMNQQAISVLNENANRIKCLILNQTNHLCISQCKAFEEVVDTQMFGFSREVSFAIKIGVLSENEGHKMLVDLERHLNQLYSDVYDEKKEM